MYVVFSQTELACGKASERHCSHSTASSDNAVRRRAQSANTKYFNELATSTMHHIFVAVLANRIHYWQARRLDLALGGRP